MYQVALCSVLKTLKTMTVEGAWAEKTRTVEGAWAETSDAFSRDIQSHGW